MKRKIHIKKFLYIDIPIEKALKKYIVNTLQHSEHSTMNWLSPNIKNTFHKRVSGGLFLNVFQKHVHT